MSRRARLLTVPTLIALSCFSLTQLAMPVAHAAPELATSATVSVPLGGSVNDTAILNTGIGGVGGTITFYLYGPNDSSCSFAPVFVDTQFVGGDGNYPSNSFTPSTPGTYHWVAEYSGDESTGAPGATTSCGDPGETTVVTPAAAITTQATSPITLGNSATDTATLAGANAPTGTITFNLYGPSDPKCLALTPVFTSTKTVSGNAAYTSDPYTPTLTGDYHWVASYSGDSNNSPLTTTCGEPGETLTVNPGPPIITTQTTTPIPVGSSATDTATLSGGTISSGTSLTGTVTFNLYGPNDPSCGLPPVFSETLNVPLVPPPTSPIVTSDPFTPPTAGTYHWVANYSGDADNPGTANKCGDPAETLVVSQAATSVTTSAVSPVAIGSPATDTATLSGGTLSPLPAPGGTITFNLYGPSDPNCLAVTPVFTSTKTVNGPANYQSDPFTPTAAGIYHWIAVYSGDVNNSSFSTHCGDSGETLNVPKTTPSLSTLAGPPITVGGNVTDTASLSGGSSPTGTITFTLFGPNNSNCSGQPIFTSTKTVTGNGTYASDPYTASATGVYNWVATYSGDANNAKVVTICPEASEAVQAVTATTGLSTQATTTAAVGGTATDTATLTNAFAATGTITFALYGPTDTNCVAGPVFISTPKTVAGSGNYTSDPFIPPAPGTYHWVAAYSGDANHSPSNTKCGDSGETLTVTKATSAVTTQATSFTIVGGTATDTATLSGAVGPTGTITFNLYGPSDPNCLAATPVFTSTKTVSGNGSYTSNPYSPPAVGTYHWVAVYSGDTNNASAATKCGDAGETLGVGLAVPTISTQAISSAAVGGSATDTAFLSGGASPTGTITFALYGPSDPNCLAVTPLFTSTKTVTGNGAYVSDPYTPPATGTYHWVARYSGDAANGPAATKCGDAGETLTVGKASPTVTTQASSPIGLGGNATDTAMLAGGASPTGAITFKLYGPSDPTCAAAPVFTSTKTVTANGMYTSDAYSPLVPGTYHWVATYGGDIANNTATTACGDPGESLVVSGVAPSNTNGFVSVNSGPTSCPGSYGITVVLNATTAGKTTPSGNLSYQDPAHGISLTSFQVISLQRTGSTAVVVANAMQGSTSVIVRIVVTAGTTPCGGTVQVTTSTGYVTGPLPVAQSQVTGV